jgi:hypothetical protein
VLCSQPTVIRYITIGNAEVTPSIRKPASRQTDSHVSRTDSFLSSFPTSSSHLTTRSMTERQSPINGYISTLSPSSWLVAMMILWFCISPWHLRLCHSPSLTSYNPTPSILGNSSSASSVKTYVAFSPTQALRSSLEHANINQMKLSRNIITAL